MAALPTFFQWCVGRGMRRLLLNLLGVVFVFSCVYLTWMVAVSQNSLSRILLLDSSRDPITQLDGAGAFCQRPPMDINNTLVAKHLKTLPKLECSGEPDWLTLSRGSVWVDHGAVARHGNFTCTLDMYSRMDDYHSKVLESVTFPSTAEGVALKADFFQAHCKAKDGQEWQNVMAGVHRTSNAPAQRSAGQEPKWNVLMFGFDSTSRLHFMRKMPKTYEFLTREMHATVLEGYNIVGDGTPQALIPILTGYTELELPDTRKRNKNTAFVNVYPFVWKNFSDNGYVTAFAEDTPNVGIFTYRLNGFEDQPTDHYMRAFYVEAYKQFSEHKRLCLGSQSRHMVMLNWLRQLYEVYPDRPKFAFGFHGELSHDDFNLVGVADDDLRHFIKELRDQGLLKDTFLIIMSDHGHRFATIRTTAQGKQEERLPFFSITPPASFRERYSRLVQNLEINAQRITCPFDLHPTFLSLLDLSNVSSIGDIRKRGISLFSRIPKERTCAQAGIEPHWCTCLSWQPISVDDAKSKQAAQAVVDFINELTSGQESKCARLTLEGVTRAESYQPNQALLGYKGVLDKDGFVPDLTDKVQTQHIIYSVQMKVHPSGGIYEASVTFDVKAKTFRVLQKDVSRVNPYGMQPHCVQQELPHLMKYCYCKVQMVV